MRRLWITAGAGCAALLALASVRAFTAEQVSDPSWKPAAVASGPHYRIVPAEWSNRVSRDATTDTDLWIMNRSLTQTVTLGDVVILGMGGVGRVLTVFKGLDEQVIPPLGRVVLPVSWNIPGIAPRASGPRTDGDVASAVVAWTGPKDALILQAKVTNSDSRSAQSDTHRTSVILESRVFVQ